MILYLTKRQKDILIQLLNSSHYISYDFLRTKYEISQRSLRNDMNDISNYLKEFHLSLHKVPIQGIKICGNKEQIAKLSKKMRNERISLLLSSEKVICITLVLLIEDHVTYDFLAEILECSKQSVVNLFPKVEHKLMTLHMHLSKTQGKGIHIIDDYLDRAKAIERIVMSNEFDDAIYEVLRSNHMIDEEKAKKYYELQEKKHQKTYIYPTRLYVITSYCLKQEELKEFLEEVYAFAKTASNKNMTYDVRSYDFARYLVDSLDELESVKQDKQELIKGLATHIKSTLYRLHNGIVIGNELLENIKISLPLIYEFTKQKINTYFDSEYQFNENEIAYIAMYIASAYENSLQEKIKVNVMLVCAFGLATSNLLRSRVSQLLPECNIIGPFSHQEATHYLLKNTVDIIITTNEMTDFNVKTIQVSPILSYTDIERIKNEIVQISYYSLCAKFIHAYQRKQTVVKKALKDYLDIENIEILNNVDSWQNAITIAAKPLIQTNKISEKYVNRMIEAVYQYGPYMVLLPGIAFVHAGTEDGIFENCYSLLHLKQAVSFGEKNIKNVNTIVVLGIHSKEDSAFLDILSILEKNAKKLNENMTINQFLELTVMEEVK